MSSLANKIAIITGASSGIGRAAARLFASEGAKVVVSARRQAELDALVNEIDEVGGEAVAVAGDVGDEDVARRPHPRQSRRVPGLQLVDGRPFSDFTHTGVLVTGMIDTGWSRHGKRRWRILVALAEFTTAWRRYRRDRQLLASLNERELRDLGIDRPTVETGRVAEFWRRR